jgi:outer membrane protein OmpA-like peptidoglycan-associated protein
LRANPGDAENSADYPGFPRQAGFVISDYTEDNPAESEFPVAHPLPLDSGNVEMVPVRGHRFIIRYELSSGGPPTVYQTQRYYEKLASAAGFQVAKGGGVGDVSETFYRTMPNHDIWLSVEPSNNVNVLTIIEAPRGSTPIAPAVPRITATRPRASTLVTPGPVVPSGHITPLPTMPSEIQAAPGVTPVPVPSSVPGSAPDPDGEALYTALTQEGRIVVPFTFQPGKEDLEASSQPEIDRIVAMMGRHPDLFLRIEGHTDNTGDPEDNLRLSAQRAIAVENKLVAADIDKKRLDAVGVGGLQPRADNNTAEGREKNRRIELVLWKKYSHQALPTGA